MKKILKTGGFYRAYKRFVLWRIALSARLKDLAWTHVVKKVWPGACLGSTDFHFTRSSRVGLDGVVIALTEQPSVPLALARAYREAYEAADEDFDLIVRAPMDRLQQIVAVTATGKVGDRQFAFSANVNLLPKGALLWKTRKVLEGATAMLLRNDPEEALKPGMDPVPQRLDSHDHAFENPS